MNDEIKTLIEEARTRVKAHGDFAKHARTTHDLDRLYEDHALMADALEAMTTELRVISAIGDDDVQRLAEVLNDNLALRAERDRYQAAIEHAEDVLTRHYLDTAAGAQILGILGAALGGTKGQG